MVIYAQAGRTLSRIIYLSCVNTWLYIFFILDLLLQESLLNDILNGHKQLTSDRHAEHRMERADPKISFFSRRSKQDESSLARLQLEAVVPWASLVAYMSQLCEIFYANHFIAKTEFWLAHLRFLRLKKVLTS